MNKIKYIIIAFLTLGFTSACVDLDYSETYTRDLEWMQKHPFNGVQGMVWSVYAPMYNEFEVNEGGAIKASTTDEAEFASSQSGIFRYYNGGWTPMQPFSHTYNTAFRAITQANMYMEMIDQIDLSDYILEPTYEDDLRQFELHPYELRFLRAYYHFELAKTYGDMPIITKSLSIAEANAMEREPVQDVFKFVVDECDAVFPYLPANYRNEPQQGIGRASKPAVLALKARTLLYAASPLFNTNNDKELWLEAAKTCKQIIDNANDWGLKLSLYADLLGPDAFQNPELIMGVGLDYSNDFEKRHYPVGIENGSSGNCPTQSLVDMYEYQATGKTFKEVNPESINLSETDPYAGLDPRFALTVIKNGDLWPLNGAQQMAIETYFGGFNAAPKYNATTTGYYLRKYVNGNNVTTYNNQTTSRHTWIIWRLAEIYLNYAEAMFEYYGDADAQGEFGMSANEAINVLRNREDIMMPEFQGNDNWKERYMRERAVEFAFEDHRFWDVRRWKKGADFFKSVTVADIQKSGNGVILNRVQKQRVWEDKYYLYPIPQSEIQKNPKLYQNPGW